MRRARARTPSSLPFLRLPRRLPYVRLSIHSSFVRSFVRSYVRPSIRPSVRLFACLLVRLFICSFVRSFIRSFLSFFCFNSQVNGALETKTPKMPSSEVNGKSSHPLKMFHHSQLWGTRHGDDIEDSDSEEEDIDPTKGSSLQKLDLSSNQIVKIPLGLSCLATNLGTLNLSNNNISDVPSLALFPTSLGTLDLSHNNLTAFHPIAENVVHGNATESRCYSVIEGQRPSMRRRISAENGLQVGGRVRLCRHSKHRILPQLKRLDLNNNKLEEIHFMLPRNRPASVASSMDRLPANSRSPSILFPSLQSLTLSHNELWSLPRDVGVLSKLGSLHVSNTKITRLPPEVGLLSELWDLQYQGLQLQDIEPSVLERKKTKDIVGYLRSVLER